MPLPVYFAPLEGATDATFRSVHHRHFTGIDKYFIPFISPTQNLVLTPKERFDVSPDNNAGMHAVPQVLTKDAGHFLWAAQLLEEMGYREINLNLGCPSGTVTGKGKGAGFLLDPFALERFLDEVFSRCSLRISLKTRIGFTSPDEFDRLLELYNQYPVSELIVHPRTRAQFYKGKADREAYGKAIAQSQLPMVYNGDLFTAEDCRALEAQYPSHALMIGRGLQANPALAREYAGGPRITAAEMQAFVEDLMLAYQQRHPNNVVLGRMREVLKNMVCCFDSAEKVLKAIRKANSVEAIELAGCRLFQECPLRENPGFYPER